MMTGEQKRCLIAAYQADRHTLIYQRPGYRTQRVASHRIKKWTVDRLIVEGLMRPIEGTTMVTLTGLGLIIAPRIADELANAQPQTTAQSISRASRLRTLRRMAHAQQMSAYCGRPSRSMREHING